MPEFHQQDSINPCFCISLRTGATVLSIFDMVYGIAYIFRIMFLEYLIKDYRGYFSHDFPTPTSSTFMHWMFIRGNYILMIASGVVLLACAQYLGNHYRWISGLCNSWIAMRGFLIISLVIFCNALYESSEGYFLRLATEVLLCILLQFYFVVVVYCFIGDSKLVVNNRRAIRPLIIAKTEQESYLSEKPTKFNNALSFHVLMPHFFLKSGKFEADDEDEEAGLGLRLDESMLQYVAAKSKVKVKTELEARNDALKSSRSSRYSRRNRTRFQTDDEDEASVITLKSYSKSLPDAEDETSFAPSDMSVFPNEERVPGSFMDLNMHNYSASDMRAGFSNELFDVLSAASQTFAGAEIEVADMDAPSMETVKGSESESKINVEKK